MSEMAINEAIMLVEDWIPGGLEAKQLAIRALEQMREREKIANKFTERYRGCTLAENDFRPEWAKKIMKPKPRTWRDVTLGEIADARTNSMWWAHHYRETGENFLKDMPPQMPPIGHEWR